MAEFITTVVISSGPNEQFCFTYVSDTEEDAIDTVAALIISNPPANESGAVKDHNGRQIASLRKAVFENVKLAGFSPVRNIIDKIKNWLGK